MSTAELQGSNASSTAHGASTDGASANSSFDIVQVLWRWKWLPILGAIIGAGLGYLYFSKQPVEYQASALVQVATSLPMSNPRGSSYGAEDFVATSSRADESMVIRSQKVLRMAVARGRLSEHPGFSGMKSEEIVGMLQSTRDLVVQPADKDDNTTLIQITYVCNDADLAAAVVNSIVRGYSDYLSEEYRTIGNDIYDVVTEAQRKLESEYKDLNDQALSFQENNPNVIWTPSGASDPYAEAYDRVVTELLDIRLRRKKLWGTIQHVDAAVKAERPAESILLMLSTNAEATWAEQQYGYGGRNQGLNAGPVEALPFELRMDTDSKRLEQNELFALQMREKELLDTVGESHPSIATVRKKIDLLTDKIAFLRESERKMFKEEDRIRKEAFENQVAPEGITADERLTTRRQALAEEYASLQIQESELKLLADESQKNSNELRIVLNSSKLLDSRIASIQTLLDTYTEKLNAIQLLPQTGQRTLKELNLPTVGGFYGPSISPYLLGGAAIGFALLSGLAVLMDLADRSYRNPEEIAGDLGVPVLGHVPVMDISKIKKSVEHVDASVTSIHHSRGRVSEAYRSVRTGLYFSQHGQDLKVIQVTSPVPGDGKSTLSSNLAVSMAQSGRRVLLIDADFRRPRLAKIFGIESNVGMATVIAGKAELDDAIHQGPVTNLFVMPGGKRPNNPAELLSSQRFSDLVDLLREKFDVIVIDTPPLLAVSDPGAVAGVVDGVVLTMRLRRNVKPLAMRATSILEGVGAKCLGVVVNGVSSEAGYGYNYDYNDYRYAYKYGSNYRSGYGYRYGYGNYRYGYSSAYDAEAENAATGTENK